MGDLISNSLKSQGQTLKTQPSPQQYWLRDASLRKSLFYLVGGFSMRIRGRASGHQCLNTAALFECCSFRKAAGSEGHLGSFSPIGPAGHMVMTLLAELSVTSAQALDALEKCSSLRMDAAPLRGARIGGCSVSWLSDLCLFLLDRCFCIMCNLCNWTGWFLGQARMCWIVSV